MDQDKQGHRCQKRKQQIPPEGHRKLRADFSGLPVDNRICHPVLVPPGQEPYRQIRGADLFQTDLHLAPEFPDILRLVRFRVAESRRLSDPVKSGLCRSVPRFLLIGLRRCVGPVRVEPQHHRRRVRDHILRFKRRHRLPQTVPQRRRGVIGHSVEGNLRFAGQGMGLPDLIVPVPLCGLRGKPDIRPQLYVIQPVGHVDAPEPVQKSRVPHGGRRVDLFCHRLRVQVLDLFLCLFEGDDAVPPPETSLFSFQHRKRAAVRAVLRRSQVGAHDPAAAVRAPEKIRFVFFRDLRFLRSTLLLQVSVLRGFLTMRADQLLRCDIKAELSAAVRAFVHCLAFPFLFSDYDTHASPSGRI